MTNVPRGCLSFLFGFGSSSATSAPSAGPTPGEEGNYHSGPGGYEGAGYSGGYAAEYRAEQEYFEGSDLAEGEEH